MKKGSHAQTRTMRFKLPTDVKSSKRYVEFPYIKSQVCAGGEGLARSLKAVIHQTSKIESDSIRQPNKWKKGVRHINSKLQPCNPLSVPPTMTLSRSRRLRNLG